MGSSSDQKEAEPSECFLSGTLTLQRSTWWGGGGGEGRGATLTEVALENVLKWADERYIDKFLPLESTGELSGCR